jgi:signal transduction histidine kinase
VDKVEPIGGELPHIGELLEIEGLTDPGSFAPCVLARKTTRLGEGTLPQPVRPTWDQLINGSLDTQYVEIQGIVTSARDGLMTLLTHGGKINIVLPGTLLDALKQYVDSLVRVRGCLFASWDAASHQVRVGEVRMFSPAFVIDEPAPEDVFALPLKRIPELLLFDVQASVLRRVKVSGQVLHEDGSEYFMAEGLNGLRFVLKEPAVLAVGDLVEVVGFPSLTGPSPVLREASARKRSVAALPEAKRLAAEELFQAKYDALRVKIEAVVLSLSADRQTLEAQAGLRRFEARLNAGNAVMKQVPVGSRVELTGVYAGRGGNRTTGAENDSFELLLNTPADVRVLALPPFWSLRRLLILVGTLIAVLAVAMVWIRLLHRTVQERTAQLQKEIREREHAENQRVRAQERTRIARDLHDDLGSSLTEITMLATPAPGVDLPAEEAFERLDSIAGKSRTIVHALDEIVWAVDPQRDTLASVARYLASYVEEYLARLNVACRVQIPNSFPEYMVPGEVRHHLFLAVKEAINNGVRHGAATEIEFRARLLDNRMEIMITDNGSGFDLSGRSNGDGLFNLRKRLENVNGRCEINSSPGAGTTVSLQLPLTVSGK